MRAFPIDFVRQILEQTLLEEHMKYPSKYYGGVNQVNLFSFYEQLQKEDEVNRYVEIYRDLTNQQNRTGLIMNGTLVAPENPTISNISEALIIPMSFTCAFRVKLADRDNAIDTINHLIEVLKGRKQDIAMLDSGKLFKVGTIANQVSGTPKILAGDFVDVDKFPTETNTYEEDVSKDVFDFGSLTGYIYTSTIDISDISGYVPNTLRAISGSVTNYQDDTMSMTYNIEGTTLRYIIAFSRIPTNPLPDNLHLEFEVQYVENGYGIEIDLDENDNYKDFLYGDDNGVLSAYALGDSGLTPIVRDVNVPNILFPYENNGYEKFKVSLSFDSLRCDEPRTLNSDEYCVISFGGSATLVDEKVLLGNELTKLSFAKDKIVAKNTITINGQEEWLEPLELPNELGIDKQINQLVSNKFVQNSHSDAISLSNQYTFILDKSIPLLHQLFKYGRYGIQANGTTIPYTSGITPNMIFNIKELWSSWGELDIYTFKGKLVENVSIENTESDTITLSITVQIQGDNN